MHATVSKSGETVDKAPPTEAEAASVSTDALERLPAWAQALPAKFSLRVSGPDDRYEQEADRVAGQVVRVPAQATPIRTQPLRATMLQREAGGSARTPPTYTFEQRWNDFQAHLDDPDQAVVIAENLVRTMDSHQASAHALELAFWLMDHGRWDLATRALDELENSVELAWVIGELTPHLGGTVDQRLRPLIDRARTEVRADHHDQAFRLLRAAFFLVQRLLESRSAQRRERLNRQEADIGTFDRRGAALAQATASPMLELITGYDNLPALFDLMRELLDMYPQEERAALLAGNPNRARYLSGLGLLLQLELREHTLSGQRATTLPTVASYNVRGERGFELRGVRGETEIVTALPGTPAVEEMGLFPEYSSPFATERARPDVDDIISGRAEQMERMPPEIGLVESITGQETLITELYGYAPIRAAFPAGDLDMNNLNHRLRVWEIMLDIFQSRSVAGMGGLYQLMSLMGRYLRVFTRHTQYNIRDFGTSYLRSEMPVDYAGRAARDCGVYALKVAYEVYRAARAVTPRLDLEFQLFSMLEHVTLVIFDNDHGQFYIVNNNEISTPQRGMRGSPEVLAKVAETYGATLGRENFVAPAQTVDLGDTGMGEQAFSRRAWQQFRLSGLWGLAQVPGLPDQYRRYYEDLIAFDQRTATLMQHIARFSIANQRGLTAEQRSNLDNYLSRLLTLGIGLLTIFERYDAYGPSPVASQMDPAIVRSVMGPGWTPQRVTRELGNRLYLSHWTPPVSAHPLTRLARALVHFHGSGLSGDEATYIDRIRNHPELGPDLIAYEQAGSPPNF